MKIYAFTYPSNVAKEISTINQLFENRMDILYLRKTDYSNKKKSD
jgi:hypothetical protein